MIGAFSNTCRYALLAVLELGACYGEQPLSTCEIAKRRGIPVRFLETILRDLKEAGLTSSSRGKDGGYSLTKAPSTIVVGDIVKTIQSSSFKVNPSNEKNPIVDELSIKATEAFFGVLDSVDIESLINKETQSKAVLNYSI